MVETGKTLDKKKSSIHDGDKQTKTRKFMFKNTPHDVYVGVDIGDLSKYNAVWRIGSMPN